MLRSFFVAILAATVTRVVATSDKHGWKNTQNTSTIEGILQTCYEFLESHLCEGEKWGKPFHFYRPALEKYSADQWLWDSGSHMIVWSHRNVTNSILDLRTMLQFQQPDGRIPEEIFWMNRTSREDLSILLEYSNTQFTDITQMPVLPYSLRSIYNATKDMNLVKEFLPALVDYFHWWRTARDNGDGLVFVIHNWESGLDASPAYDEAFHTYITTLNETALHTLYPKFIEVIETYKLKYHWNMTEILARTAAKNPDQRLQTWFKVKDVAVNCVYASGWKILGDLATLTGLHDVANDCYAQYEISSSAIMRKMYSVELSRYSTLFVDADGVEKTSSANTIQNLFPLLLNNLPAEHVEMIVSQLMDEKKFNAKFMIPTTAMDDPHFSATFDVDLMWRGPVWGFTNWFIMEGLGQHQRFDLQAAVLNKWIELVQLSGIYEHYNPLTGEPYGPEGLGMSTLICDYLYRYDLQ